MIRGRADATPSAVRCALQVSNLCTQFVADCCISNAVEDYCGTPRCACAECMSIGSVERTVRGVALQGHLFWRFSATADSSAPRPRT